MESQTNQLKIIFLPYLTPGHMKPMIDTARLFAKHGASVTIIATKATALSFQKDIDSDFSSGLSIKTHLLQFPAAQLGLPDGVDNIKSGISLEMRDKILLATSLMKDQIELLFEDIQPDCLVTGMFYPWTVDSAAKLGIPRLYFHVTSYFCSCVIHSVKKHKPHEKVASETQKFSIPGLPESMQLTTLQLPEWIRNKTKVKSYFETTIESESKSYGILCNSFHEIESEYEELYKSITGVKSWSIGPVSSWINKYDEEKASKGPKEETEEHSELLNWLNSKENESVLYISFGSLIRHSHAQLLEIAHGLENSGHDFIWVVRNMDGDDDEDGDTLPRGFVQRMKESKKGYIIWNWAPQLLIVNHPAIGGIVTHCGWNAVLESMNAGLPMITWPLFAEQFDNEILLADVLKVAVPVGTKENKIWMNKDEDAAVKREEIVKAVKVLMGSGEESIEIRKRAKKLAAAAKRTIEEGGSSYNNLLHLMEELKSLKISKALRKSKLDN